MHYDRAQSLFTAINLFSVAVILEPVQKAALFETVVNVLIAAEMRGRLVVSCTGVIMLREQAVPLTLLAAASNKRSDVCGEPEQCSGLEGINSKAVGQRTRSSSHHSDELLTLVKMRLNGHFPAFHHTVLHKHT